MITYRRGNLLDAEVEALVNTVNTVGVMGKGIALQFSRMYPEIVKPYKEACSSGGFDIGQVLTVQLPQLSGIGKPNYVINFPTKRHWKGNSQLQFIESGLNALVIEIRRLDIRSIAIPPLGCGLGGLRWSDVRDLIETKLGYLSGVDVLVYEPAGAPDAKEMTTRTSRPHMTAGRAVLLALMRRYLTSLMDDSVSLLEVHKLMYFMQEAGEDLELTFVKGTYGPYATNLRHLLIKIEGHFISGFGDASEVPGKPIEPFPQAIADAEESLANKPQVQDRLRRVQELMVGFETPFGMELLGSVHWVRTHEPAAAKDVSEAVDLIRSWNARKCESFKADHVAAAWRHLSRHGWIR